ncbi:MAG: DUF87 domain-containing protein [Campylobacterales bacterium]|nr:DUF87 domain-containing protein [Campylobacterales bacterium]
MQNIPDYEKLNLFYLGKEVDVKTQTLSDDLLLYKNKDLTTHAAIIGMTGSGKTGLGIGIIEEAAIDRIPSLIIDPKGDMGNLLLQFENLKADEFEPWIDPQEAEQKGMDVARYAAKTAQIWSDGLQSWHQDKARISKLKNSCDFAIYTPGSSAGLSISILSSFEAPSSEVIDDVDTFNALVDATITSLLALINIDANPLSSREYLLLSNIFAHFWKQGVSLSMEELIGYITNPPFEKVGVMQLASFYPQKDRLALAMLLNNVIASPTFASWIEGEPLDIQNLLYTGDAKPRVTILSIAHLNDQERMFFVTLLLNKFIGWMRKQSGTSSLRALLYMDEVFGFFPATSKPPSKEPMLLLLKQARAFGVGVVLSTQNPIDIDYKGLSNIGSWFIGRLQTKQDRDRLIDGLIQNDTSTFDKKTIEELLSSIKSRTFVFKSAKSDSLSLFQTRWVLSYLRGPIAINEIKKLMEDKKDTHKEEYAAKEPSHHSSGLSSQPILSENIPTLFLNETPYGEEIRFEPYLLAKGGVGFYDKKRGVDEKEEVRLELYLNESFSSPNWEEAEVNADEPQYDKQAPMKSLFYSLPQVISQARDLREFEKDFANYLYRNRQLELFRVEELGLESQVGETMQSFKIRINDKLKEQKDQALEKLKEQFVKEEEQLESRYKRAVARLEKEEEDVSAKKTDTILSVGLTILDAFMGRKTIKSSTTSKAASAFKKAGSLYREKNDVEAAQEEVEAIQQEAVEMKKSFEVQIEQLSGSFNADQYEIESFAIKPRRSDIFDIELSLLWKSR